LRMAQELPVRRSANGTKQRRKTRVLNRIGYS
jgi:hypothetical protein